jgi:hypothetical protein
VLTIGVLFVAACGGSGSPKQAAQVTNTTSQTSQSSSNSSDSSSASSSAGGGTVPTNILDATYNSGKAHVEISGDANKSVDINSASGFTGQGSTFLTFRDANGNSLTVTMSKTEAGTGVAVTVDSLTTGGQFNEKCRLELTQNDSSGLVGTFTCAGVDGVDSSTDYHNLNVKGSFSAKP